MFRPLLLCAFVAVCLAPQVAFAQLSPDEIRVRQTVDSAFTFLKLNAVNRTLVRATEGKLAGGKVGYSFRREATLVRLEQPTPFGFCYDTIYKITQQNWDLDAEGKKTGEVRTEDRVMVVHTDMAVRKSTFQLAGISTISTSSRQDWGGSATTHVMKLADDKLTVVSRTALYDDFFASEGKFYPGATVETEVWSLKADKLTRETKSKPYRVDPDTLEMKADGEERTLLETETARLPR